MIPEWHTWRRCSSRPPSSRMCLSTPWSTSQWRSESKIHWKENSCVRNSRIAFTAEASNLSKTKSVFHQEWWTTQRFLTRVQFIYTVDRARDLNSIADAGLVQKKKNERSFTEMYALEKKEDKQFILYHGVCTICLDNNASEAEVITDTKKSRKVNHQIHWRPEQDVKYGIQLSATQKRILADTCPSHHYAPVYAGRMRCQWLSKKIGKKNCSQDNSTSRKDQM